MDMGPIGSSPVSGKSLSQVVVATEGECMRVGGWLGMGRGLSG